MVPAGMDATARAESPPTPAAVEGFGGGHTRAPAVSETAVLRSPRLRERLVEAIRASAWTSAVSRGAAVVAGMLALASIGAVSALAGRGVPIPVTAVASADANGMWLAAETSPPVRGGPSVSGDAAPTPAPTSSSLPNAPPGVTADGKVILNTATTDELTKLPRVGPKRAQAIVALRQKLGRFRRPTDLLRVRGIGRKTLRVMMPAFVLDPPTATRAPDASKAPPAH